MASVTPNLKLRLSDDLTADARFNLNKLDSLASVFLTDSTGDSVIRSQGDIRIEPNSSDIGGTGSGGSVDFGSSSNQLTTVNFFASTVDFQSATLDNFTVGALDSLTLNAYSTFVTLLQADQSSQAEDLTFTLPAQDGTPGQVLQTDGSGNLSFVAVSGGTLNENNVQVGSPGNSATDTDTSAVGDILADTTNGFTIKAGAILDADVNASAAITLSKLAATTASRALVSDGSGFITASAATATEVGYLSGVTSGIQSQLDGKFADPLTTRGDLLYRDASSSVRLALGTNGQVLQSDGTDAAWASLDTDDIAEGSNQYYTNERAQDAIGTILLDTSSIDFTYDDGTPNISATVLPAGVDHNSLNNYSSDEHIGHSTVDIATSANSGLAGGGDLTSTRSLTLDVNNLTAETASDDNDAIPVYDSTAGANRKMTRANFLPGSFTEDWTNAQGSTKVVTHSLGTANIMIQVFDTVNLDTVFVDSVVRTDANTVTLTASTAPANTLRVLILEVE